jgi:hypothetical protein
MSYTWNQVECSLSDWYHLLGNIQLYINSHLHLFMAEYPFVSFWIKFSCLNVPQLLSPLMYGISWLFWSLGQLWLKLFRMVLKCPSKAHVLTACLGYERHTLEESISSHPCHVCVSLLSNYNMPKQSCCTMCSLSWCSTSSQAQKNRTNKSWNPEPQ